MTNMQSSNSIIRDSIDSGYYDNIRSKVWGGAGLGISEPGKAHKEGSVWVETRYATQLSALVLDICDGYRDNLDYITRYEFFEGLGREVNRSIERGGDTLASVINGAWAFAATYFAEEEGVRLYFAYGSNMDENRMAYRCPNAKPLGKARLDNMTLGLDSKSYATVYHKDESWVEGLLWSLEKSDEKELDRREGVSIGCYSKHEMNVMTCCGIRNALVYISEREPFSVEVLDVEYIDLCFNAAVEHGVDANTIEQWKSFM